MRILITGAGLIGTYAAAELIDAGHEVVLFERSPLVNYIRNVLGTRDATIRTGDIIDIRAIPELAPDNSKGKVDLIVHTAGVIGGNARENPYAAMRTNLIGTIELAEAARLAGVQRIVYAGTHGVYDLDRIREAPFLETAPVSAHSVYGATKLSSEHVLRAFGEAFGIKIVILRFPNVYGYGEFAGGSSGGIAFHELLTGTLNGNDTPIPSLLHGNGEWLYVKDAARAIRSALEHPLSKQFIVANVGSGALVNEGDMVASMSSQIPGARFLDSKDSDEPPRSTQRYQAFDLTTAREEIGYSPAFTLDTGIQDYIQELRKAEA